MKPIKYRLLSILFLSCTLDLAAQPSPPANMPKPKDDGYEITGYLTGLKDGTKVMALLCYPGSWQLDRRDSGYVKNGVFHIQGVVPDGPRYYLLTFDGGLKMHLAIANNEKIFLHSKENVYNNRQGFLDNFVGIEGARYNTSVMLLLSSWFLYDRAVKNVKQYARKVVDSVGFDGPTLTAIYGAVDYINRAMQLEIFTGRPNQLDSSFILGYALLSEGVIEQSKHASFIKTAYDQLPIDQKKGVYGEIMHQYANLSVGQILPELDHGYQSSDGSRLSIKDVAAKGKLTLVNFWGTNSPYMKRNHDELKVMYKMYHDKGLNILAVSTDDYAEAWQDALEKERSPWFNVLEKKGGIVDSVYHEFTADRATMVRNTTNVVIDPAGKILAWDVEGAELQWYLWKYLQ